MSQSVLSPHGVTRCPQIVTEHPLSLQSPLSPWGHPCPPSNTFVPLGTPTSHRCHPLGDTHNPLVPFFVPPPGSLSPSGPLLRYETGINGAFLSGDIQVTSPRELLVTSGGLYLLYGQFALSCAATECPQGTVTLQLRRRGSQQPLLAVTVTTTPGTGSGPARSGLSQAVGQLEPGDVLSLALVGDTIGDNDGDNDGDGWQLEQDEREGNFVGLLRIAGG